MPDLSHTTGSKLTPSQSLERIIVSKLNKTTNKDAFDVFLKYIDAVVKSALGNIEAPVENLNGSDNPEYVRRHMNRSLDQPGITELYNDNNRKEVISQTLDLFLKTNYSDNKTYPKPDSAFTDLTRAALVVPFTDFLTKLVRHPNTLSDLKTDQRNNLRSDLLQIMEEAFGVDLSVSTILDSKMRDDQKLELIARFDLQKLKDGVLVSEFYDLLHKNQEADSYAYFLNHNLPSFDLRKEKLALALTSIVGNFSSQAEVYRVLSELDLGIGFRESALKQMRSELSKDFAEAGRHDLIGKDQDSLLLAKFAGKFFARLFAQGEGLVWERAPVVKNVIEPLIDSSVREYKTLTDSAIVFLNELSQIDAFRNKIRDKIECVIEDGGLKHDLFGDSRLLVFLFKVYGKENFEEIFVNNSQDFKGTHFSNELSLLGYMLSKDYTEASLVAALKKGTKEDQSTSLNWAPMLLDKAMVAKTVVEVLGQKDYSSLKPEELQRYFDALMQCGEAGFNALNDLTVNASQDGGRPEWFYTKLIDAIFMMVESPAVMSKMNQELEDNSELKINPINLLRTDDELLKLNPQRAKILVDSLLRLYGFVDNHYESYDRLMLWLRNSSNPIILEELQKIYKATAQPEGDSEIAVKYLRYLRYLSGAHLSC